MMSFPYSIAWLILYLAVCSEAPDASTQTLTGHVCEVTETKDILVSKNVSYTCTKRTTEKCGFWNIRRCTKYRESICYKIVNEIAQQNITGLDCCPGYKADTNNNCSIVIGIDISHVTENKPASSTTESSGAHTSGTNTHIHNGVAEDDTLVPVVVSVTILGVFAIIFIVVCIIWWRKRKTKSKGMSAKFSRDTGSDIVTLTNQTKDLPPDVITSVANGKGQHKAGFCDDNPLYMEDGDSKGYFKERNVDNGDDDPYNNQYETVPQWAVGGANAFPDRRPVQASSRDIQDQYLSTISDQYLNTSVAPIPQEGDENLYEYADIDDQTPRQSTPKVALKHKASDPTDTYDIPESRPKPSARPRLKIFRNPFRKVASPPARESSVYTDMSSPTTSMNSTSRDSVPANPYADMSGIESVTEDDENRMSFTDHIYAEPEDKNTIPTRKPSLVKYYNLPATPRSEVTGDTEQSVYSDVNEDTTIGKDGQPEPQPSADNVIYEELPDAQETEAPGRSVPLKRNSKGYTQVEKPEQPEDAPTDSERTSASLVLRENSLYNRDASLSATGTVSAL